ncbi:MAG: biopolymer transporter ExbD, partial [Pseudomonadales bacterium]
DATLYIDLGGEPDQAREIEEIQDIVSRVLAEKPNTPVMVWGDTAVPYGQVVGLMTALQNAGAESVGLVTEPPRDL